MPRRKHYKPDRFVFELPPEPDGSRTFIAVDSKGHTVDEQTVPKGFETHTAICDLWETLDRLDPVKQADASAPALRLVR